MRTLSALAGVVLLLAACGPAGQPAPATPAPPANGDAEARVDIVDLAFEPPTIDVATGASVTWTNNGDLPHTVTFDDIDVDSGNLPAGAVFTQSFGSAGSFRYHCAIHPQMTGTVSVGD
ncbi:MAG TPA: cupredoxin domain-containing protein [Candidatus Limnocylindria bacterium]|nr:cupredoxin domain-containing protein [Candidatus Limnocylindria bacterium]